MLSTQDYETFRNSQPPRYLYLFTPRTMLLLNLTATLGMTGAPLASAIAQSVVHDPLARLTKRYSALALQLRANATSTPAPTVQPASIELVTGSLEKFARTLPKAAPPVP